MLGWARDEHGDVGGYVVPTGSIGWTAARMTGKTALRAVWQAEMALDGAITGRRRAAEAAPEPLQSS